MSKILIESERLRLRRATESDLDYIMALVSAPENLKFVVPFSRDYQEKLAASDGSKRMNGIIEEKGTGVRAGYFMLRGLDTTAKKMEWTQLIIERKGLGYGHETFQLMKAWSFGVKKFHRIWLDCKEYNDRGIHLYESEGFIREGLMRDTILTDGVYENLIILGMLDQEYQARKEAGKEL